MNDGASKVFSREVRLRRRSEFAHVRKFGENFAARRCAIQVAKSPTGTRGYAFVISRRYSLRAVDRNRARRLFRESYRKLLPLIRPAWIVFRPRHSMKRANQKEVQADLEHVLRKAGVLVVQKKATEEELA
jgi:ribonuclease P protein component